MRSPYIAVFELFDKILRLAIPKYTYTMHVTILTDIVYKYVFNELLQNLHVCVIYLREAMALHVS